MRNKKARSKKKQKFRILLDSAFAQPKRFPRLSKKCNLKHPVHDYGFSPQTSDEDIYQLAIKTGRFVLTINFQDFKKLIKKNQPGIIGIESQLTNEEIDPYVIKFLSNKDPQDYLGKALRLTEEAMNKLARKK